MLLKEGGWNYQDTKMDNKVFKILSSKTVRVNYYRGRVYFHFYDHRKNKGLTFNTDELNKIVSKGDKLLDFGKKIQECHDNEEKKQKKKKKIELKEDNDSIFALTSYSDDENVMRTKKRKYNSLLQKPLLRHQKVAPQQKSSKRLSKMKLSLVLRWKKIKTLTFVM